MVICEKCGNKIMELPRCCSYCGHYFCTYCTLPETHNCKGLKKGNIFKGIKASEDTYIELPNEKTKNYKIKEDSQNSVFLFREKKTRSILNKIISWLNKKKVRKKNTNIKKRVILLLFFLIFFIITFFHADKFNSWLINGVPVGNLLTAIFFVGILINFILLLENILTIYNSQKRWIKLFIFLAILFLIFNLYQNKSLIFNKITYVKHKIIEFVNSTENLDESDAKILQKILLTAPKRKKDCKTAFDYVNEVRKQYDRNPIAWEESLYQLAVFRSKDMYDRDYFDHVTPEGKCVKDFKADYGFSYYNIAENIGGMTYDSATENPVSKSSPKEAADAWLKSRGHRYNILYPFHTKGAIGCYKYICVFLGANTEPYGLGAGPCTTGAEGLSYWQSIGKQLYEI